MAKVKQPLLSLDARRKLGDQIVYGHRQKANIVQVKPIPSDARSVGQLSWRHMFLKVVALWHALSAAEKEAWESLGRKRHMTGYAWFVSQALRPNPGIYLPLQGGTMTGAIDMDGQHIHGLPAPVHLQDPLRRQDYVTYIQPFLLTEGARAFNNATQAIPNATTTIVALNSERYDTDSIHDNITNNSRLTCKTAGKYVIIANIGFAPNVNGVRNGVIRMNGVSALADVVTDPAGDGHWRQTISTIWDLAVTDYVELTVWQNRGDTLNTIAAANISPELMMQRIG